MKQKFVTRDTPRADDRLPKHDTDRFNRSFRRAAKVSLRLLHQDDADDVVLSMTPTRPCGR